MKEILTLLILNAFTSGFSQSFTTVFRKDLDSFHHHKINDVEVFDNIIMILGSQQDQGSDITNYYLTTFTFEGEIINQSKIKPGKYDFLNELCLNKDMILLSGGIWHKDDEGIIDYVMLLDNELNLIWERELENKWEGSIMSIQYNNGFLVSTNSNSGVLIYKLSSSGETVDKKNIATMQTEGLFNIIESKFLLVSLSLGQNGNSQIELITLTHELDILNKSVLPINKKDYLKKTYFPEHVKFLENGKIASLWSGKPPITKFSTPHDTTTILIKHIRQDINFFDIEHFENDRYIYSGTLGDRAAVFLIEGNKILTQTTFGNMGIWSKNKIVRMSDVEYILITDIIRSDDFESNIEIARIKIE